MASLSAQRLLSAWEHGARRHPIDRALLLYALTDPGVPSDRLADAPLGERNAALMALRRDCFGSQLASWLDCRACGERLEVTISPEELPTVPVGVIDAVQVRGHRFVRVTTRHVAQLVGWDDMDQAAHELLRLCAVEPSALPSDGPSLEALLVEVGEAWDAADPWADLTMGVSCPACRCEQEVNVDVAEYLWDEVDGGARRLLDEVHVLASAYGWSEADILALTEARRAAYLSRVQA